MKPLFALNQFFWKYRWRLLLGICFIVLTNYVRILSPQIAGYVVNTVVNELKNLPQHETTAALKQNDFFVQFMINIFEQKSFNEKLVWSGIILLLLAIVSGIFMFLMRQTIIVMSRLIEYDQKNQVYSHYQKLDLSFFKKNSTGDLMNRISEDISRIRMYTGPAIMYFMNLAAVLGFSVFFMYKASPKLTIVALLPLPVLALTVYFVNTLINRRSEKLQAVLSNLTSNAQESYSGIRVIKSYVQEKSMIHFFKTNSIEYRRHAMGLAKMEAIYFPSMSLLVGVSTLFTIMVGLLDVIHDPVHNKVGIIAEFVIYIQMMTFPVSAIGWTASITQRAAVSQKRLNEFLNTKTEIVNVANPIKIDLKGRIDFSSVSFKYANTGIEAVKNFSLNVKEGEKIAIIGKTGSGKTTVLQMLLRMYNPDSGNIFFDEKPIRDLDIENLRQQISYVPQDNFLFSDSVENNIAFGSSNATQEEIVQAAKQANIHHEIMNFKEGYKTIVGERGVTLSGGQKQRISIARALLKNSKIVIFDDCLSAVDANTEHAILSTLNEYLVARTAIIVTHRIFSLFNFDKIIVMDQGKVVEEGTHVQLLEKEGFYYSMYTAQQEFESFV